MNLINIYNIFTHADSGPSYPGLCVLVAYQFECTDCPGSLRSDQIKFRNIQSQNHWEHFYYIFMLHFSFKSPSVPIISCPNVGSDQKIDSF